MNIIPPKGYVMAQQGEILVIRPGEKPELYLPEGMDLYYNPMDKTWIVVIIDREKIEKKFDLKFDREIFKVDPPEEVGNQKISALPRGFSLVKIKEHDKLYVQPVLDWTKNNGVIPATSFDKEAFFPLILATFVRFIPAVCVEKIIKEA